MHLCLPPPLGRAVHLDAWRYNQNWLIDGGVGTYPVSQNGRPEAPSREERKSDVDSLPGVVMD